MAKNENENVNFNIGLGVVAFFLIIIGVVYLNKGSFGVVAPPAPTAYLSAPSKYDDFAKCLTAKGVKMYGAFWCPHCINQKNAFGSSFQYLDYQECTIDGQRNSFAQACKDAGIEGYPTWKFSNGTSKAGEVPFEDLASLSGCALPQ